MDIEGPEHDRLAGDEDPMVGMTIAGRYRLERRLGAGGMASVYMARQIPMGRRVAVKLLHHEMTNVKEAVSRFEREAVVTARVGHPHIVAALDFGRLDDGTPYLALEYVEGKRLREAMVGGPFAAERALGIVWQVASALEAAHEAGVVHRDLKPENILLIPDDSIPDFVKVFDFGMAKPRLPANDDLPPITRFGHVSGTPKYMAPEQALQRGADHRVDIYSLGVMFFEMLSGDTPFHGDDPISILKKHVQEAPPELPSSVPQPVRALVTRMLAKDPISRPQTATELMQAIERVRAALDGSVSRGSSQRLTALVLLAVLGVLLFLLFR